MKLHVIQDYATPHNNVLLSALKARPDVELVVWYAHRQATQHGGVDLTSAITTPRFYNPRFPDMNLIGHVLAHPQEKILLVGWANATTRVLFVLLCLLRRRFSMWFDLPDDSASRSGRKQRLRAAFYRLLRGSRAQVFCVGEACVAYFKQRGFVPARLTNLPIYVDITNTRATYAHQRETLRSRYNVPENGLLLATGSRLIYDKGFDIILTAMAALPKEQQEKLRLVIVGEGPEKENLKQQAHTGGFGAQVFMAGWLAFADYEALIAAADVYLHPARFDAWGATIFAHTLGVAVIGSTGAGSAAERVKHETNGWLFNPTQPEELTRILANILQNPKPLAAMGKAARTTAEAWAPTQGAKVVIDTLA